MGNFLRLVLFGVAVWAVPFGIGIALFPFIDPSTALFDTLMSLALALSATAFAYLQLRTSAAPTLDQGLFVGTIWMVMALALDAPFFIFGPEQMRMAPADYMADIGFAYAMIPIIAAGIGHALRRA
jgi:hypothetical protein